MAGLPPLAGFVAKEACSAPCSMSPARRRHRAPTAAGGCVLVGVVLGSALTVAYTPGSCGGRSPPSPGWRAPSPGRTRPVSWPPRCCSGVLLPARGFLGGPETTLLHAVRRPVPRPPGTTEPGAVARTRPRRWLLSVVSLALGLLLFWQRRAIARCRRRSPPAGAPNEGTRAGAAAGPHGRRGHRRHPARVAGDLPRA